MCVRVFIASSISHGVGNVIRSGRRSVKSYGTTSPGMLAPMKRNSRAPSISRLPSRVT